MNAFTQFFKQDAFAELRMRTLLRIVEYIYTAPNIITPLLYELKSVCFIDFVKLKGFCILQLDVKGISDDRDLCIARQPKQPINL